MDIETLKKKLNRCLGCKTAPCAKACPLGVSPHDFIAAAKNGNQPAAAEMITARNPLPQTCGLICPDKFCQKACIRARIDAPVEIPCLQADIIQKNGLSPLVLPEAKHKKAAIIGGGPAGLGALYELLLNGWHVDLYEKEKQLGGAARYIPEHRLPRAVLDAEIERLIQNDRVTVNLNTTIKDYAALAAPYDGVILALGEPRLRTLGINGEEHCTSYKKFLTQENNRSEAVPSLADSINQSFRVAVCGGGEVALDCALTAADAGAKVEMFVRRRREDMRIMARDQKELDDKGIVVRALTSITRIDKNGSSCCLTAVTNEINAEGKAVHCHGTEYRLEGYNLVIQALGSYFPPEDIPDGFILAGDMDGTCGTVVQALASGRAAALKLIAKQEK